MARSRETHPYYGIPHLLDSQSFKGETTVLSVLNDDFREMVTKILCLNNPEYEKIKEDVFEEINGRINEYSHFKHRQSIRPNSKVSRDALKKSLNLIQEAIIHVAKLEDDCSLMLNRHYSLIGGSLKPGKYTNSRFKKDLNNIAQAVKKTKADWPDPKQGDGKDHALIKLILDLANIWVHRFKNAKPFNHSGNRNSPTDFILMLKLIPELPQEENKLRTAFRHAVTIRNNTEEH